MQFATCDWQVAMGFLQNLYPSKVIDFGGMPKLKKLVVEDVLRIQDPDFHKPCQIVRGNKYLDSHHDEVREAIQEFIRCTHNVQ